MLQECFSTAQNVLITCATPKYIPKISQKPIFQKSVIFFQLKNISELDWPNPFNLNQLFSQNSISFLEYYITGSYRQRRIFMLVVQRFHIFTSKNIIFLKWVAAKSSKKLPPAIIFWKIRYTTSACYTSWSKFLGRPFRPLCKTW